MKYFSKESKLERELNKLIGKKVRMQSEMQKLKKDSLSISKKINELNINISKMKEVKKVVLMAIASGSETKESTGSPVKLITGLAPLSVLAVNPTKKELETIYGRELDKDPEYLSADEAGVKKLRIDFIVKTVIDEKKNCNEEVVTKVSFFLEDRPAMTSGGDKVYMLNLYGESACIPLADAKNNIVPENMAWYCTTKMRPAFKGEVELVDFLKAYLTIPNRAFKDKVIPDITQAEIQLDSIKKYFATGEINEIKSAVKSRMSTNKVMVCGGVRTTDDNKQYQAWYLKKPLKYGVSDLTYIKRDIKDRQTQLNVDFGPEDLKFRIYSNEPTAFTQQSSGGNPFATTVDDDNDPFGAALASGIPANASGAPAKSWFEQ